MTERPQYTLAENDLTHVLGHLRDLFSELHGQSVFLTGGTGFFGMWLVESFLWSNEHLKLNANIVVLSRCPEQTYHQFPHLKSHQNLSFVSGDVRDFKFDQNKYAHILHAAGTPLAARKSNETDDTFEVITEGTRRIIEFAEYSQTKSILFVSSGAVYDSLNVGRPILETDFRADYVAGQLDPYASGKLEAERLGMEWASQNDRSFKIARCFSFLGAYFPLEAKYAASMFFKNALRNEPIQLVTSGSAKRSYLYAADLAIWLWTILLKGESCRPYNVGSPEGISLFDFASKIASQASMIPHVERGTSDTQTNSRQLYVPNVDRAKEELSLVQKISLDETIKRTFLWYRRQLKISQ